jgi:hypothetical protein
MSFSKIKNLMYNYMKTTQSHFQSKTNINLKNQPIFKIGEGTK